MVLTPGHKACKQICDALGIQTKGVKKITLTFEVNAAVTATIERFMDSTEVDCVTGIVNHFEPIIIEK